MASSTSNAIPAQLDAARSSAGVKLFRFHDWPFLAEDGGTCHTVASPQVTLVQASGQVIFTGTRVAGGREGRFSLLIQLCADDAVVEVVRMGEVYMGCGENDAINLAANFSAALFDAVNRAILPATSETNVKAC